MLPAGEDWMLKWSASDFQILVDPSVYSGIKHPDLCKCCFSAPKLVSTANEEDVSEISVATSLHHNPSAPPQWSELQLWALPPLPLCLWEVRRAAAPAPPHISTCYTFGPSRSVAGVWLAAQLQHLLSVIRNQLTLLIHLRMKENMKIIHPPRCIVGPIWLLIEHKGANCSGMLLQLL